MPLAVTAARDLNASQRAAFGCLRKLAAKAPHNRLAFIAPFLRCETGARRIGGIFFEQTVESALPGRASSRYRNMSYFLRDISSSTILEDAHEGERKSRHWGTLRGRRESVFARFGAKTNRLQPKVIKREIKLEQRHALRGKAADVVLRQFFPRPRPPGT
jgi:hypothetical protein